MYRSQAISAELNPRRRDREVGRRYILGQRLEVAAGVVEKVGIDVCRTLSRMA
jgi:hypothetical protein